MSGDVPCPEGNCILLAHGDDYHSDVNGSVFKSGDCPCEPYPDYSTEGLPR